MTGAGEGVGVCAVEMAMLAAVEARMLKMKDVRMPRILFPQDSADTQNATIPGFPPAREMAITLSQPWLRPNMLNYRDRPAQLCC